MKRALPHLGAALLGALIAWTVPVLARPPGKIDTGSVFGLYYFGTHGFCATNPCTWNFLRFGDSGNDSYLVTQGRLHLYGTAEGDSGAAYYPYSDITVGNFISIAPKPGFDTSIGNGDGAGGVIDLYDPLYIAKLALKTCNASTSDATRSREGTVVNDTLAGAATGHATRWCGCQSDGASTYKWVNLKNGNVGTATTCPD